MSEPQEASACNAGCVSRGTQERLNSFVALVGRWNQTLNLISRADVPLIWSRHVGDCTQWAGLIPASARPAIDFGSGGGFPGLLLALVTGRPFLLVEADARKAAFLREAVRITEAPAEVVHRRAEQVTQVTDLVTSRAAAPLPRLLAWSHPLLEPGGACLFMKGRSAAAELAQARLHWRFDVQQVPSSQPGDGTLLKISALAPR